MSHVVLVHGAWNSAACWHKVVSPLTELGHEVSAVSLHRGSLAADTAAVRSAIDGGGVPAVVCGHSYGGAVITGLTPELVAHAVYLTAAVPDPESWKRMDPHPFAAWVEYSDDRTMSSLRPDVAREFHYQDCDPETLRQALAQLVPQENAVFDAPPAHALWKQTAVSYVVCENDLAFPAEHQRFLADRASAQVRSIPTSHSPFLSRPDLVIAILHGIATAAHPASTS